MVTFKFTFQARFCALRRLRFLYSVLLCRNFSLC